LIGNGAAMLLGLPEVRAEVARDPSRWPAAIEDLMRLVSPNQFIRRQAREDIDVGDQTIRAADALLLILAAANRDPEAFPEPDQFVFDRPNRQNVARPATALSAGRHILNARNPISPTGAAR
jgi:cytochrome P450